MKKLTVLTGAGMSADSGLSTFRDSGGLWEGYDIEEVASVSGWNRNMEKVLDFYNLRRSQAANAQPNQGHIAIAELEDHFDVTVVTQNVDDLHERAGSSNVVHLHGLLREARSSRDPDIVLDIGSNEIKPGDMAEDGSQLRPNIVWFGEPVPMISTAAEIVMESEIFVVVGTSLVVYPAASLTDYVKSDVPRYIVDPSTPELYSFNNWHHIKETAAKGVPELKKTLIENYT